MVVYLTPYTFTVAEARAVLVKAEGRNSCNLEPPASCLTEIWKTQVTLEQNMQLKVPGSALLRSICLLA